MANKKINQLVAKTTIQSTDLFPIGDATTGTLYKKTIADLQAAIGGAVISVNGLVGTVVLDADDILETASPTNRYFTDARARAAISLTTSGSSGSATYSSSTGVLNVPTYTLAGLGGITATFLSGGTGITYNSGTGVISYSGTVYTDSSIRALFSAGTGLSYNSSTGVFSISGTIYTDSSIRALFSGTSPITYNSTTGAIGITGANLTESTSSVLTITGGTGALLSAASIQVKQASGSQSGFLSSTDWTTFNNKQNALTNPVTGTSTSGYVTFWNGSGTITGDSGLFWDNTNKRLGIGTTAPDAKIDVSGGNIYVRPTGGVYANNFGNYSGNATFTLGGTGNSLIISGGNVGIGTTSPTAPLHINVAGSSSFPTLQLVQGTSAYGQLCGAGDASHGLVMRGYPTNGSTTDFSVTASDVMSFYDYGGEFRFYKKDGALKEQMRITSGGNVGIGTSSPSAPLSVVSNTSANALYILGRTNTDNASVISFRSNSGSSEYAWFESNVAAGILIGVNGAERVRFVNSGNMLLGTTTDNGERLYVSGSIRATGTITANSDIALKKNLAKIENALEKVEQINGYTYEFKADDSKRHAGVIAQEIQGVLPEIVNKGNDGLLGVEYGNISALLIEAIKEQQAQINELKALLNK